MANLDPRVILLGNEPDVTETRFTQTINEGGPMAEADLPETIYPVEETANIPTAPVGLQPRGPIVEKTGGGGFNLTEAKMKEIKDYWDIGPIPVTREVKPLREYLITINARVGTKYDTTVTRENLLKNIRSALREAYEGIIEEGQ